MMKLVHGSPCKVNICFKKVRSISFKKLNQQQYANSLFFLINIKVGRKAPNIYSKSPKVYRTK